LVGHEERHRENIAIVILHYGNGIKGGMFKVSKSFVCRGCTDQ